MINDNNADDTFTIACKRTIGDDETFTVAYFTQDSTTQEALYPDSSYVTDLTWDTQAADFEEE